jgi:hypothetical protein
MGLVVHLALHLSTKPNGGTLLQQFDNVQLFNIYPIPPGCHAVYAYAFINGILVNIAQISI